MATKCIKVALEYIDNKALDKKILDKELKDIQYKTYLACNRAMTYLYTNDMQSLIQKEVGLPKESDKELYGKSLSAFIENRMNEIMEGCLSSNVAQTRQFVSNRYNTDKKQGLLKGNVSLSQFKRSIPIILHNVSYKIKDSDKGYVLEIGLFNLKKQEELRIKRLKFLVPGLNGHEKATMKKIFEGTYKLGSGQITYNERKKKWIIAISYSFDIENTKERNNNLVMGIDLGITKVATMSIYDTIKEDYLLMNWKERVIEGEELIRYRQNIAKRNRDLSIASKWASENNSGHGYKSKMETCKYSKDKYNRFKETYNHKVSKYIVDLADKYNVGLIQMENLSGYSEQQSESLLKNWCYYDLQNKIQYKATEKGIAVNLINPQYTSQRCSNCGNIHKENRDCKNNQSKFECTICKHNENADINASKNIAIPDIENIILEQIEGLKEKKTKRSKKKK